MMLSLGSSYRRETLLGVSPVVNYFCLTIILPIIIGSFMMLHITDAKRLAKIRKILETSKAIAVQDDGYLLVFPFRGDRALVGLEGEIVYYQERDQLITGFQPNDNPSELLPYIQRVNRRVYYLYTLTTPLEERKKKAEDALIRKLVAQGRIPEPVAG